MKKKLFCLLIVLNPLFLKAQVVFNAYMSFDALLEQATKEKKFIFIQFESDKCPRCNEVAMTGLASTQLKEKYAVNFVSTKAKSGDNLHAFLMDKYQLKEFMGSLYLDNKGNLLLKNNSTTSLALQYIRWADEAIGYAEKLPNVAILEQIYQKGDRTPAFLEKYIRALRDTDKDSDALMDEFIGKLPVDSLHSDRIIQFVKEQGLSINARAYKLVTNFNSSKKVDSLWYLMPLSKRISINNRTTNQTFNEAVKTKNRYLLSNLNDFTRNIYKPNYRKAEYAINMQSINYCKATKDTVGYLIRVENFANSLMSIKIDSLKAWDTREREEVFSNREPEKRFMVPSMQYATDLNNFAYTFYLMTDNVPKLESALLWSAQSMAIFKDIPSAPYAENASFLDTYAHLLYKLKRYDEAIDWQTKAIDAQKAANIKSVIFEEEREKMKNRKL